MKYEVQDLLNMNTCFMIGLVRGINYHKTTQIQHHSRNCDWYHSSHFAHSIISPFSWCLHLQKTSAHLNWSGSQYIIIMMYLLQVSFSGPVEHIIHYLAWYMIWDNSGMYPLQHYLVQQPTIAHPIACMNGFQCCHWKLCLSFQCFSILTTNTIIVQIK